MIIKNFLVYLYKFISLSLFNPYGETIFPSRSIVVDGFAHQEIINNTVYLHNNIMLHRCILITKTQLYNYIIMRYVFKWYLNEMKNVSENGFTLGRFHIITRWNLIIIAKQSAFSFGPF